MVHEMKCVVGKKTELVRHPIKSGSVLCTRQWSALQKKKKW